MSRASVDPTARPDFDLSGGALCIDFANTWEDRAREETDRLQGYHDLLAFGRATRSLDPETVERLARLVEEAAPEAEEAFGHGLELRESLYRILSAVADGRPPRSADLDDLNGILPAALRCLRVVQSDGEFQWSRRGASDSLLQPLWPVARSAAELLTGGELDRLRECDGHDCNWLFLDRSRNRSRRWCSMATCGNRAKARRHYRRTRGE